MSGNYGFSISLEFVPTKSTKLAKYILGELGDESNGSIILKQTLLIEELMDGQIIFFGTNEDNWGDQYDQEVINKLTMLCEKYDGHFVGRFEWHFYEENLTKLHTFHDNGRISTEFLQ
jgi:hypothetical protein